MIQIEVIGGTAAVQKLQSFSARLQARLDGVMEVLGASLEDAVRDNLGGGVLQRRSGRLAAGVTLDVEAGDGGIAVSVGAGDVPYAAFQEYGFHGTETIRAHLRTIRQAFGRPIAPRAISVKSYIRHVDYPAHSFLRSALADIAPGALTQIDAAVGEVAAG
jgi:hypothetical protein